MKFYIDSHSSTYDNNNLFDLNNKQLNRDDGLVPFFNLKSDLIKAGYEVATFDLALKSKPEDYEGAYYISFGRLRDIDLLVKMKLKLYAIIIMEPPLTNNKPYKLLPELSCHFDYIYTHNTYGDGFDVKNVDVTKLKKLFWPQPHKKVVEPFWSNTHRLNKIVIINGKHRQKKITKKELYSERITWSLSINKFIPVDLYGRGWSDFFSRHSLSFSYLFNFINIHKIYKGPCESKFSVMSQYDYALCFENFQMDGYITEKIFDCFYSGVIPIYWGAGDVLKWLPKNTFIDIRNFSSAKTLVGYLTSLSTDDKNEYRLNAKNFIENSESSIYYDLYRSLNLNQLHKQIG